VTDASITAVAKGPWVRLVLRGEVDMANAAEVEADIRNAISNQVRAVSIDLSDVGYLDSAGLRILFGLATRLPVLQIDLEIIAPIGSPVRRVIELSGLPRVATVSPGPPPPNA
jgi:anti-anti-sigma factor